MALHPNNFLFLDCQTTGMRPSVGHLLEFAWAIGDAAPRSSLICLPEGHEIPAPVRELTGIGEAEHRREARPLADVFAEFQTALATARTSAKENLTAIIHYAQFEKPFLVDLYNRFAATADLPFKLICSQQLAKRLFPNLPSHNIRGAAGFFGAPIDGIKRAAAHVSATQQIWAGLSEELAKRDVHDLAGLEHWLSASPRVKATRYEYRLDKLKRLELPDTPGIYRMISKSGEVLYVGKATSLKSRVNSYFRGKKGRDRRKLEMLAQVWDLRVSPCATPLEAAILESDEIKKYNPPYNVVFKRGRRHLVFYNHDFSSARAEPSAEFCIGPFRNSNWIEHLRLLDVSRHQSVFAQVFFEPFPPERLREAFAHFCEQNKVSPSTLGGVRSLLALGLWIQRRRAVEEAAAEAAIDIDEEVAAASAIEAVAGQEDEPLDLELSIEELAGKFERLLRRAGLEYRRSQKLTRLLNAEVTLHLKEGPRRLRFSAGQLSESTTTAAREVPWAELKIDDYDRMSILLSELANYEHSIR